MDLTGRINEETTIEELLQGCDSNFLKGLAKNKIIHPTFCQEQLLTLSKERDHIVLRSGMVSGKTTGLLIALINDFINKIKNFSFVEGGESEEDSVGLFSVLITASKDLAQKNHNSSENMVSFLKKPLGVQVLNLSTFSEQSFSILPKTHYLVIATPSTFLRFAKHTKFDKKKFVNFAFDDIDYMLSFGYKTELTNFEFFYGNDIKAEGFKLFWSITEELSEDLKEIKKTFMNKSVMVNIDDDFDNMDDQERKTQQALQQDHDIVTHYYTTGDDVTQYIIMYVLFKLKFLQGKSLILCENLETLYKVEMFLDRIGEGDVQIYNHENPKNLRYYLVSLFNTGVVKTLISTTQIFTDLKSKDFQDKKVKTNKLKGIKNIVVFDLLSLGDTYNMLYKKFNGQPGNIFNLVQDKEKNIEDLMNRIEAEKEQFNKVNFKEFPLRRNEIEAFRYRVNNVFQAITHKQVQNSKMLDFKKKMLKSPDMKEYYANNINEKELLVESIQKLTNQLKKYEVRCEGECPDYLLPVFLQEQKKRAQELDPNFGKKVQKILVYKAGTEGKNKNMTEEGRKKLRGDKYVYVNEEKENENETDHSRLKILSRKKQWKLRHGFKLRKVNRRLEKKGIFNAGS